MAEQSRLLTLKVWELQRKYESITAELQSWKCESEAGKGLAKHHRQIRRLAQALQEMIGVVKGEVDKLGKQNSKLDFFRLLPRAEFLILEVHRTWHYFREKLVLRHGPPFGDLLEALDECVWSCYHPAFVAPLPEPPLTFLSGEWSPTAFCRHATLVPQPTAHPEAGLYDQLDESRLRSLIIPTISLPWYEITFLPEALMLAHEVAHLVDDELQLGQCMQRNLAATDIDTARLKSFWKPWSAEIFADLYGVLSLGPAFVGTLARLIARTPSMLAAPNPQSSYPPGYLRMLVALEGLRSLGFTQDAATLETHWVALYGPSTDFGHAEFVHDVHKVVAALLDRPFEPLPVSNGGVTLKHLPLRWTEALQASARTLSQQLLSIRVKLGPANPRVVLAAAELAFQERPEIEIEASVAFQSRLVKHILAGREKGTRARRLAQQHPMSDALNEADRDQGRRLAEALLASFDRAEKQQDA